MIGLSNGGWLTGPWRTRAHRETSYRAQFGYIPGLDGIRLLAVSIVVIQHFRIIEIMPGGFGVSIFFFISGFLISRLLLAEEKKSGRVGLGAFYVRRFIRLLPPLLLMGAVAVPLLFYLKPGEFALGRTILSFAYLGNLSELSTMFFGWGKGWGELGPLWSLAVEEQFYLLFPPMLFLLKNSRSRIMGTIVIVVLPLVLRVFVYCFAKPEDVDPINYLSTPTRIDALAWGVLLTLLLDAGIIRIRRDSWLNHLFVWGGAVFMLATLIHWTSLYELSIKYTPQSIAIGVTFFGVIFGAKYRWLRTVLEFPPLRHLGSISYEIYLWHALVFTVVIHYLGRNGLTVVGAVILSVLVSELAYRLTTGRLKHVRERFGGHPVS